ncbi:MAG: hypothetical protein LWX70_08980 [Sphingobacteriia bacterium]|nr:hypothetical protein [Sphingobacteriia bacterium]
MTWDELYPVVSEQAYYAVLRYDERRKDKIQELVCQSYEKYQRDVAAGKEIKKQDYKCFVTQRAKSVDVRSVVKGGGGGTSTMDPLGFYRRRPDSPTSVVEFDEWMTGNVRNKEIVDSTLAFNVDYKAWLEILTGIQRKVFDLLIQGYKASRIAEKAHLTAATVKKVITQLKELFVQFFHLNVQYA